MDAEICKNFLLVRDKFPDQLNSEEKYTFKDEHFKDYCNNGCENPLEKINAVCLYLLYTFFGSSDLFSQYKKNYMNIVEYIMIWLSYMLNLKDNAPGLTNQQHFYTTFINKQEKYTNSIKGVTEYKNYKDLIDRKEYYLKMDNNIVSKLYNAFKLLCEIYTEFNGNMSNCTKCSEKANKFVNQYEELNDPNNIKDIAYCQALSTLSNDYNNLKNKCKSFRSLPEITTKCSAQMSVVTSSSSSIANKLFIVLSIFGAIGIFFGISYKVNNKDLKNYFHYIYANINKIIRFLKFN
ncbi:putative yir3 protein [Plasmodium yoelii yoelii]|uniref:Yir3 protein n=1 Tax=Plasmodium yoelii yoelii TaxID=73239 RepID=Q7R7S8_PLAYO|nr:putative yir3 protein [Plasmodium yoelii yoelii]